MLIRIYAVEIVLALWDVALKSVVNITRNCGLAISIIFSFSVSLIISYILFLGGYSVKEIAFTKDGVIFRRRRNPIVIQNIASVKEASWGRVLKLTGSTPEGETVNRRVSLAEVGEKRWEEFKKDLQKHITVKMEE